jgi:hypothetical protein
VTWLALVGWIRKVPWQAWAGLALAGLLLATWVHGRAAGSASVQARWDASEARHAAEYARLADAARQVEARHRADYAAAAARFNQENADALAERDAVIADLRAGTVRLRERFRCPAPRLPGTPAGAAGSDGADGGGFTVEDAAVALRIASDGDTAIRRLTACQAIVRASHDP